MGRGPSVASDAQDPDVCIVSYVLCCELKRIIWFTRLGFMTTINIRYAMKSAPPQHAITHAIA